MTLFAVHLWLWELSGSATMIANLGFISFGSSMLFTPVGGVVADSINQKKIMICSDIVSGICTIALLILKATGSLQIWHLYTIGGITGACQAFQIPAFQITTTVLVPDKYYGQANGFHSMSDSISYVVAPILAGILITWIYFEGILIIDVITFLFAVTTLSFVKVPQIKKINKKLEGNYYGRDFIKNVQFGFHYIFSRNNLFALQAVFFFINMITVMYFTLLIPFILAKTHNNSIILGAVQTISGIGGIAGGIVMASWGGTKKKINGVLLGMFLFSLSIIFMGLSWTMIFWAIGSFFISFSIPITNSSNQAIWQKKIPVELQGRVFSARRFIAQISVPLALIVAGPLAEYFFEPSMLNGSTSLFAKWFVPPLRLGIGSGFSLMFVLSGIFGIFVATTAYLSKMVRNVEET